MLSQDALADPDRVATWLRENGDATDRTRAREFFTIGLKAKAQGRWGIAIKAFGDSAIFYPAPVTLAEYADARLRELGTVRARKGTVRTEEHHDLATAERLYRSALAADGVLNAMTGDERRQVSRDAACLSAYLETSQPQPGCRALSLYRSRQ